MFLVTYFLQGLPRPFSYNFSFSFLFLFSFSLAALSVPYGSSLGEIGGPPRDPVSKALGNPLDTFWRIRLGMSLRAQLTIFISG